MLGLRKDNDLWYIAEVVVAFGACTPFAIVPRGRELESTSSRLTALYACQISEVKHPLPQPLGRNLTVAFLEFHSDSSPAYTFSSYQSRSGSSIRV